MIKLPGAGWSVTKAGPATRYKTMEYAENFIKMLTKWDANDRKPMFIQSDQVGMAPVTLRQSFYHARTYIRENPDSFPVGTVDLANAAAFEVRERPIRGIVVLRASRFISLSDAGYEISTAPRDDEKFAQLLTWINAEHELNDKLEILGPFTMEDIHRFGQALENLRGIYLSRIDSVKLTVIYHPGGR